MSLAAVAVRNQRRRAAQQQQGLGDEALTQKSSLDASDPNLKLRKVCVTKTFFIKKTIIRVESVDDEESKENNLTLIGSGS